MCNETEIFLDSRFATFYHNRKAHHEAHAIARLSVHRPLHPRVFFLANIENDIITRAAKSGTAFIAWFSLNTYEVSINNPILPCFVE